MQSLEARINALIEMKKKYNALGDWLADQEKTLKAEWLAAHESGLEPLPPVFVIRNGLDLEITKGKESEFVEGARACLKELVKVSIDLPLLRKLHEKTPSQLTWACDYYKAVPTQTVAWRNGILKADK